MQRAGIPPAAAFSTLILALDRQIVRVMVSVLPEIAGTLAGVEAQAMIDRARQALDARDVPAMRDVYYDLREERP